jgi:hypothetical protein
LAFSAPRKAFMRCLPVHVAIIARWWTALVRHGASVGRVAGIECWTSFCTQHPRIGSVWIRKLTLDI